VCGRWTIELGEGAQVCPNWEEEDGVIYGRFCGPGMVVNGWRDNS
jgi:hypothetical protein